MSDQLRIDVGALDALWKDLCRASAVLGSAKYATDALREAVGNGVLVDRVGEFSGKWDHTRGTIVDGMDAIWHQAKNVHDTWVATDQQLAQVLTTGGGQSHG